jgi:uncharacterized membrane protein
MKRLTNAGIFCLTFSSLLFAGDYHFGRIDVPGSNRTIAAGINARGDIVDLYDDAAGLTYGFLLHKGVFSTIDFPGASFTAARAINAHGDIVGRFEFTDRVDHGFWLRDGRFSGFDFPGSTATIGRGINNAGDITGNYTDAVGNEIAFVLQNGKFRQVNVNPCSGDIWMAMDNGLVFVGDNCTNPTNELHGFLRDRQGKFHVVDFPGLTVPCTALRWINEREEIVGLFAHVKTTDECYDSTTSYRGFLLQHGAYTAINVPGAVSTQAWSINDDGQIVGQYTDKRGVVHGFRAVKELP